MKLENIIKKKTEGKWFEIPGTYFESDPVKLQLKPISSDDLAKMSAVETKYNKKTHAPYEWVNKAKQNDNLKELLASSVLGWEGIDEEFNRINWNTFITNLGNVKVMVEYDDEQDKDLDVTLSAWITKTCLNAEMFFKDDTENL